VHALAVKAQPHASRRVVGTRPKRAPRRRSAARVRERRSCDIVIEPRRNLTSRLIARKTRLFSAWRARRGIEYISRPLTTISSPAFRDELIDRFLSASARREETPPREASYTMKEPERIHAHTHEQPSVDSRWMNLKYSTFRRDWRLLSNARKEI